MTFSAISGGAHVGAIRLKHRSIRSAPHRKRRRGTSLISDWARRLVKAAANAPRIRADVASSGAYWRALRSSTRTLKTTATTKFWRPTTQSRRPGSSFASYRPECPRSGKRQPRPTSPTRGTSLSGRCSVDGQPSVQAKTSIRSHEWGQILGTGSRTRNDRGATPEARKRPFAGVS
jgi:hypothetical protein